MRLKDTALIYSPTERIPIGEPVILPDGAHGIRFKYKRKKHNVTEVVPLDKLHELVMQSNALSKSRDPRLEELAHPEHTAHYMS